jgi:hypothetical protein
MHDHVLIPGGRQPTATGNELPITKPKNRPPVIAMVAGDPISSSIANTSSSGLPRSGNGSMNRSTADTAAALGATARSSQDWR